jgi:ribosomal protein L11 methyltransferase
MAQLRYHLRTSKRDAERLFAILEGALEDEAWPLSIVEIDEKAAIFEISAYADEAEAGVAELLGSLVPAGIEPRRFDVEPVPDIDWVTKSLEGLQPVRAGRFLVHGSHDRDRRRIGDIAIEIEAGLAFGTGHHGTTAGCLQVLSEVVRRERPRNALDLGTGSAVLAIALAKMAHIPILATDIDPVATAVARENVQINGVTAYVACATAPGFHHPAFSRAGPFDLIVANILARPLMRLAPDMARHVAPGGSLVLSGILDSQRDAVISAYVGQRFRHVRTLHREGWVAIHLKR